MVRDVAALALLALTACHDAAMPGAKANGGAPRPVQVIASVDLDPVASAHEFSGLAWDSRKGVLLAISDRFPVIAEIRPSADFRAWTFGARIAVSGVAPWDGEGIVWLGDQLIIANERPARLVETDRTGKWIRDLPLPEHFSTCRNNRCLESLTVTSDSRYLFTANEAALPSDGPEPSDERGTTVRIARIDRTKGETKEWAYATDPVCAPGPNGEVGVTDLVALDATSLLVLERSYVPNVQNRIRLYRVRLEGEDVLTLPDARTVAPLRKTLLFDIADLDPARPFVPNYEGMCLGPQLSDGRALLFLVSDDNARADQIARLLVLAVSLAPSSLETAALR